MATSYNHPYYLKHMQAAGYEKDIDWVEFELRMPQKPDEKIARLSEALMRRYNLRLLKFKNKKEMLRYADALFELFQEAYQHLYGFTLLTRHQVDAYIKQYFGFMSPDFVPMVVDAQDRMVAFGITLPSLSLALQKANGRLFPFGFIHLLHALRKNDKGDLYLVAVSHDYQGRGVNALLINRMIEVFKKFGIKTVESNPELENNHRVQAQWKNFEHRQHKRRRVFIKYL
jgi:GNAT superfamily N-acetyltransferase